MSCGNLSKGISSQAGQHMVDRTPAYERKSKKKRTDNQVMSHSGIIRPDKRNKPKYY